MNELFAGLLLLIDQYGLLAVVLAGIVVIAFMFSRSETKARDSRTEITKNANDAQSLINKRVTQLETDNTTLNARTDALQEELSTTTESLRKARRQIIKLTEKVNLLESEKTELASERDRLRSDLDDAHKQINELERQLFRVEAQLRADKEVRETTVNPILELLKDALAVPKGDTNKLNPAALDNAPDAGDGSAAA